MAGHSCASRQRRLMQGMPRVVSEVRHRSAITPGASIRAGEESDVEVESSYSEPQRQEATDS